MTIGLDLREYQGRYPRIDDPLMRAAYLRGVRVSELHYPPGTADWDQKARQVLLNEETAPYLYSSYTPLDLHYVPGSRPQLERLANRVVRPGMKDREKVRAIIKYCHKGFREEFANPLPPKTMFLNASEEEILKLGGGQCEDRSRLIICLCQIAGIPARFIAVYSHFRPEENYKVHGGHAIIEIYVEGTWAFFDSSVLEFYCVRDDGRIASLWDLRRHPELVENQPESVHEDCGESRERFVWYRDEYLSTRSAATIANYFVWHGWRYDWRWVRIGSDPDDESCRRRKREEERIDREVLAEIGVSRTPAATV